MRMKIWMIGGIAALSLIMGLAAQDGPNSQSSQTVARPKKAPAPDTGNNTPADDGDLPKIPSKLSPKATKDNDAPADATFSECFRPSIGMRMWVSHISSSDFWIPSTSWPNRTQTGKRGGQSKRSTE